MYTNKRLLQDVDVEEGMHKKRPLLSPSSEFWSPDDCPWDDFSLEKLIPSCWRHLLWSKKYQDSFTSSDSILLQGKLEGLCHMLLSPGAPEPFKGGANSSPAMMLPIHLQSAYCLAESLLESNNEELIQQACSAIAFLSWCCRYNYVVPISFGAGVVKRLFNLVEKEKDLENVMERKGSHDDSPLQAQARIAICSIAFVDERVRQEISEKAKLGYPFFEWPFLYEDKLKAEHACVIVACIFGENKDGATWEKIEAVLIPHMIKVLTSKYYGTLSVVTAAAYAISRATNRATHEQIEKLVDIGCLNALCCKLILSFPHLVNHILDGIEGILRAGAAQRTKKYVELIAHNCGWSDFEIAVYTFYSGGIKSFSENKALVLVAKYARKRCTFWNFCEFVPSNSLLPDEVEYDDDDDDDGDGDDPFL